MKRSIFVLTVCIISLVGAGGHAATKKAQASQMPAAETSASAPSELSGKVVETMNAGGYTYISIEKNGKKTWVAIPKTPVKVGQEVTFVPGAEMRNFPSKSLNRTFDSIIFSAGLMPEGGMAAAKEMQQNPHGGDAPAKSNEKISVEKAKGADAYTIGEIYEKLATLDKKTAVVKGKVVKVSESIMGKNWIHLQDGTGDAAKGTNKLITTTQDRPAVGDIVTMKGTIYKDKDFGSGYRYKAIMEQASVQH